MSTSASEIMAATRESAQITKALDCLERTAAATERQSMLVEYRTLFLVWQSHNRAQRKRYNELSKLLWSS